MKIVDDDLGLMDGLVQLSFLVQGAIARAAARSQLSVIQLRLLGLLRDREPEMTELAAYLSLDKSSVTGLVGRAEQRGLVKRTVSERDRRAVSVAMTQSGQQLVREVAPAIEAELNDLARQLTVSQRAMLSKLVSRMVIDNARERGIDGGGRIRTSVG
jgi:MarR family transcriptional regulator, lower aerobic nicotinate degradation pathway regulator